MPVGVGRLHARDRAQAVEGVGRAGGALVGAPGEALLAHQRQVDRRPQRAERLVRADVAHRLLAPNVLLARLQRQHEAAAALRVVRRADDAAGHFAHVLLARGHEAEVGPAERERQAEALALARHHVRAHRARRLHHAQRHRIDREHRQRADGVRRRDQSGEVVEAAEEVRVLHQHRGDGFVQLRRERRAVGQPARERDLLVGDRQVRRVALEHRAVDRVDALADQHLVAAGDAQRHHQPLEQRRAAVVERRIGRLHVGQPRDGGLVLVDRLQGALRRLRLVGRVGREELAAARQRVHRRRDEVVIEAAAAEVGQRGILRRQAAQHLEHLQFRAPVGNFEIRRLKLRRYVGEQVVEAFGPDLRQHRLLLRAARTQERGM